MLMILGDFMKINLMLTGFLLILVLFFSCSSTQMARGRITIKNTSKSKISNIYIGDTFITAYLEPGSSYDYWYYENFEGKLNLFGIASSTAEYMSDYNGTSYNKEKWEFYINDLKLKLKTGYWVIIHADTADKRYVFKSDLQYDETGNIIYDDNGNATYNTNRGEYKWISFKPSDDPTTPRNDELDYVIMIKKGHDYVWCSAYDLDRNKRLSPDDWLK